MAEALNELARGRGEATAITGSHVSRWERGIVRPSRLCSQLLAEHFKVTLSEIGLTRQRLVPPKHAGFILGRADDVLTIEDAGRLEEEPNVIESHQRWLHVRQSMHRRHAALARAAAQFYPEQIRLGDSGVLTRPGWWLDQPIDLSAVEISLDDSAPSPQIDGTQDTTSHVRPLRASGGRYVRYSHAVRDIAKPKLFENRLSWRLTRASFSPTAGHLSFGRMNYFEAMDTSEALAHETAQAFLDNNLEVQTPSWHGLNFRKAIGDPFDLRRRAVIMSINTITLRRDKHSTSVVLHNRNAANVATSGGVIGVMPVTSYSPPIGWPRKR